jgi:hypothetical protein
MRSAFAGPATRRPQPLILGEAKPARRNARSSSRGGKMPGAGVACFAFRLGADAVRGAEVMPARKPYGLSTREASVSRL